MPNIPVVLLQLWRKKCSWWEMGRGRAWKSWNPETWPLIHAINLLNQ